MDFVVRYFNKDRVTCRYLTSKFLGHTHADNLKKFKEGIKDLEKKKMLQILMDGPNVNWKLYDSIVEEWNENDDYPDLIDFGLCSPHVVHGAFRTGVQKTKWRIDSILQTLYNCITKYVCETLKQPKSQVPTSGYFATLRSAI